jgi:hypothetical protein
MLEPARKPPTTYAARKRRAVRVAGVNMRQPEGYRLRRYIVALAGGADRFNALDLPARTLVIQAATAVMQTEAMAAETVKGAVIAPDVIIRTSGELRRLLRDVQGRLQPSKPEPLPFWQRLQAAAGDSDGSAS